MCGSLRTCSSVATQVTAPRLAPATAVSGNGLRDLDRLLEGRPVLPLHVGLGDPAGGAVMDRVVTHLVVADAAAGVLAVGVRVEHRGEAVQQRAAAAPDPALAAVDPREATLDVLAPQDRAQILVRVYVPAAVVGGAEVLVGGIVEAAHALDVVEQGRAEAGL